MPKYDLPMHQHGKNRVRLGRTWREGNVHHFVEWTVATVLESAMEQAFFVGDNSGMTATDTQKNTVYVVAKRMSTKCTIEEYAVALAQHFVATYPLVSKAKISVEQKPWNRVHVNGVPHDHGYMLTGTEIRTVFVTYDKAGKLDVTAGIKDMTVLKTTQSGYEGYLIDQYTTLPPTKDRIVATSITCTWKYATAPHSYDQAFNSAKQSIVDLFYGPPKGGVFSGSVQNTMYQVGEAMLDRISQIESVFFNMPNIHFLPCNVVGSKFENDVYVATSEPHGTIEAVITRKGKQPHAKL